MTSSDIKVIVNELDNKLKGNFISNSIVINSTDILLSFSFYRADKLFISLSHNKPFVSLVKTDKSISTLMGGLNEILRQKIKDCKVSSVEQINNDRIFKINLTKMDDFSEIISFCIVFELIPHKSNLLILNKENKIEYAYHYTNINSERLILKGGDYIAPINNYNGEDIISNLDDIKKEADKIFENSLKNKVKETYKKLGENISSKLKTAKHKIKALNSDLEKANKEIVYIDHGNMLLAYQDDFESIKSYIKDNNIEYKNEQSVYENANQYFKKGKKAKSAIIHIKEELDKTNLDIELLENDLSIYKTGDEDNICSLKERYPLFIKKKVIKTNNASDPYFFIYKDIKILFGRNAEQNDRLTFKLANKEHYFFHVKNYSGSHVIISKSSLNEEEILFAAQVAIYASKKDIGEVDYAKVSSLKKGNHPGQVILSEYKTVNVKYIDPLVKNLVKNAKR